MNDEIKEKYLRKIMIRLAIVGIFLAIPTFYLVAIVAYLSVGGVINMIYVWKFLTWISISIFITLIVLFFTIANFIYRILNPDYKG